MIVIPFFGGPLNGQTVLRDKISGYYIMLWTDINWDVYEIRYYAYAGGYYIDKRYGGYPEWAKENELSE